MFLCKEKLVTLISPSHSDNEKKVSKFSSSFKKIKYNLLYYLFSFYHFSYKLSLDTGAKKTLFSNNFVDKYNLPTFFTKIINLILTEQSKVIVNRETSTIGIRLG